VLRPQGGFQKAGIGFSRTFELLGKKGLASAKVKGSWFHDFEEAVKEISTAHFLCAWLELTSFKLNRGPSFKPTRGVEPVRGADCSGISLYGSSRKRVSEVVVQEG
jgi:hypothetical protein